MVATSLKSGATVDHRYRVERLLGRGELGCTYLCRDLNEQESLVALKPLTEWSGAGGLTGLRQELSFLSRFKHPHLVHLMDFGVMERGQTPYVVRQFAAGVDIFQGSTQWNIEQVLDQLSKICRVLHFLHSRSVIHRHLKPSNIILAGGEDSDLAPKMLDFGLERCAPRGRGNPVTLAYTAPEILLGHAANPRSDLYSLGILAYQLLTRRLPFEDDDEGYLIQKHLQGKADMRPVERLKGGAGLAQVLLCLLEKDPEKRPSSAEDVIRLLSAASGRDYSGTVSASAEAYFSPGRFVGRDKEMASLQECAQRVRENGRGWTVFLSGESGAGKSRCLEEFRTWALLEGWRVVEAACMQREDRSYAPYRRILAQAHILRPATAEAPGDNVIFRFDDSARMGETPQFELSSGSAAGPFRDQLTREVVRLLADRPTLLLLHDFHWADEATITVLDYLTSDILAHPVFLCVSLRPGESEHGPLSRLVELSVRQQRAEAMALGALPLAAVEDMIAGITGEAALGREIGPQVHQSSGGNPFFVEEILKHLVDRNLLRRESGKWRLAAEGLEDLKVPSSVASVLRHRLAQLSPGASATTRWLALIKHAVPRDQLRALGSLSVEELEARLMELLSRQIIREVGGGKGCFEFQHALISEVITEDLPAGRRRRMHQKIGEMLEEHLGDQESLQELAMHFTEGRCGDKAISYAFRAARTCKAEFANELALRFYEYLLGNKDLLPEEQLCQVTIEAADTYCALGNPKRAIRILEARLRSIGKRKPSLSVLLYTQLSRAFQYLGNMEKSELAAKRGMSLLQNDGADSGKEVTESSLLSQLAFCMLAKSQPRIGLAMLKRSSFLQSKSLDTLAAGHLYILISALCGVACDFNEGVAAAMTAISALEPQNAYHLLPMAYSHLGNSLAGLGKLGKALEQFERSVSAGIRTRSPFLLSQALCNLTECYCRLGKFALAVEKSAQAGKVAAETENPNLISAGVLCRLESQVAIAEWSSAYDARKLLTSEDLALLPIYLRARAHYLSASLFLELGCLEQAISDVNSLQYLMSAETPIYEANLGEAIRARICFLQGGLYEARDMLWRLETKVKKRRWAYQLAITKLDLAEVLLTTEDWQGAAARARDSLRLAIAMPAVHLQARAHYLQGKIAVLWAEKSTSGESSSGLVRSLGNNDLPGIAHSELGKALELSGNPYMVETSWRAHHMMMRLAQFKGDLEAAFHHAQESLRLQTLVGARVPNEMLAAFKSVEERRRARDECERVVRSRAGKNEKATLSIGEMEAEHLRVLCQASSAINAIRDLDLLMDAICAALSKAVGMERILVALRDEKTGKLRPSGKGNFEANSLEDLDPLCQHVLQEVFRTGRPFVSADTRSDPRLMSKEFAESCAGSLFCAPLVTYGQNLGLLYADHRMPVESLSASTINMFAAFCNIAAVAIDNAVAQRQLVREKSDLEHYLRQVRGEYPELVGRSAAMEKLRERIGLAAASPLDVLISGESGTGKELVARALHRTGRRAERKFVPLDCGSLSDSLVESELFGYRKGAFTGATDNRAGLLEAAEGGVIFLDEISNLSLRLQRKLLRVLQEREIRRIGDTFIRKINVQVIAATNKDLRQDIRAGKFRKDLFFRLNAMEISVPPLRERMEDVPVLLEWFLDKVGRNEGGRAKSFSQEAHALLINYSYPGNVRELKHIVEGAYYSTPGNIIEITHLPAEVREGERNAFAWEPAPAAWPVYKKIRDGLGSFDELAKTPFLKRQIGATQVRQLIHLSLAETGGRYRDAFRLLGIPEREYAIMIQFLKRNGCYLDFRPYRRPRR